MTPQAQDYGEAASLAFELRQPRRLLAVVSAAAVPVLAADAASASSGTSDGAASGAGLAVHLSLCTNLAVSISDTPRRCAVLCADYRPSSSALSADLALAPATRWRDLAVTQRRV